MRYRLAEGPFETQSHALVLDSPCSCNNSSYPLTIIDGLDGGLPDKVGIEILGLILTGI